MRDLQRIAIINRSEPAMRLIHAVHEYNREHGTTIRTLALYTDPDSRAMFVREADEAVCLGPALLGTGAGRRSAYLDHDRVAAAMVGAGADAAWVGWGFVAEDAAFAERCRALRIAFLGPSPEAMRRLGDKIAAKRLAEQASVPVAPWSGGPVETLDELHRHAARLGYPLMIKAAAGGGGRGIRQVLREGELDGAFDRARAEAAAAFGDPTVFVEQQLRGARHVEVQALGDQHGTVWAVGVRDCTIQRRHQKVLEEAPSPALTPDEDQALRDASVRLLALAGYESAGTVEFLFEPGSRRACFMEANTRLQVEHPTTECTTGLDLVKLQIHIARGGRLEGQPPKTRGHAIEVRLCAEDPERDFSPAPGLIERLRFPTGPGVRVDTGVCEGDAVVPEFDSMIAKLIAYGADREEALARLRRAIASTSVVIRGGTTNKSFLLALLDCPVMREGAAIDTIWLDDIAARGLHLQRRHASVALLQAAIDEYESDLAAELSRFLASASRGRPTVEEAAGRRCELLHRGHRYLFDVRCIGPHEYRVAPVEADGAEDAPIAVEVEEIDRFERQIACFGGHHKVLSVLQGADHLLEVDGVPHRVARDPGGVVRAAIPAVVVSIAVKPGDRVAAGARLATLEAMKMEVPVSAPLPGRVRAVLVQPNSQVPAGTPLVQMEPLASEGAAPTGSGDRVAFPRSAAAGRAVTDPRSLYFEAARELRQALLGFDVPPADSRRLAERFRTLAGELPVDAAADPEVHRVEDELLRIFTDVHALFRRQRDHAAEHGEFHTPREYLTHYLRALEARAENLPAHFRDKLDRALAWYGIAGRQSSVRLQEALLRIHKSHERMADQVGPISSILERRLAEPPAAQPEDAAELLQLIDRVRSVSAGRFPALADLATEVHYVHFARPLFKRGRAEVYARVDEAIARLREPRTPAERAPLMESLVECPQPLANRFTARAASADRAETGVMLEALTRRFYRIRSLEHVNLFSRGENVIATGEYVHEGRRNRIFTAFASWSGLPGTLSQLAGPVADTPPDREVVADIYVWDPAPLADADGTERAVREMLQAARFARPLRRIAVTLAGSDAPSPFARSHDLHFTFRPSPDASGGYFEQRQYRGIHPMMAKRLHIWRLENFDLERLPSVQDVYLYRAAARENPKDERLFAMAEVRDATPVRNAAGRIVEIPHLERMLSEALAAIRLAQARRGSADRLEWNRVLLYVWQPLVMTRDELIDLIRRAGPATEGLGLEQVVVRGRMLLDDDGKGTPRDTVMRLSSGGPRGLRMVFEEPTERPMKPLAAYERKVVQLRRRGLTYPYEILRLLAPRHDAASGFPPGEFVEHDLDAESGRLVPVDRPPGGNEANIVTGVIRSFTPRHPEGITRVIVLGDPSREMGSLAEPECHRVEAAIDLAAEMGVPLEWFALSAGAKISMKSGTENMDWVARVLRRLIRFTQAGGEVNVIVCGINVGAQPYWNAEATMLMHTRGILIMMPESAMVLTGKQALDYSGSVSAEDNLGIGGYERIMGPNGQAQYLAHDLADACRVLLQHYEFTYLAPGDRFPRRAPTSDPSDRDVRLSPHGGSGGSGGEDDHFATLGDVFSDAKNPGRKRPFEIRRVMAAVADQDHPTLERWRDWRGADTAVVWDAFLGGQPVCLLGIESQPVERLGFVPADGPDAFTAGTLFPQSSKKLARAINAASGNRPLVVLANLSGFDGSPESMRRRQLEYGAEIGRAVVNFDGPIAFCVVSRYHGGAFVVFSRALNENFEAAALEGSFASVIGGAPAAAVVFAREVDTRTQADPRVRAAEERARLSTAKADKARLRVDLSNLVAAVRAEKLGEVADEFDAVHSVERALRVGSLDRIISPARLRPYLIDAVERGMRRTPRR